MNTPLLTIAIPTYNRIQYLRKNLDILLPQLSDEVEVVVSDNCSTDETAEILKNNYPQIKLQQHKKNVGAELNILSCFDAGTGKYVWSLCDDDVACSNSVALIIKAIKENNFPPILFLRSEWQDKNLSNYSSTPVSSDWQRFDRDQFLYQIGQFYSVTSSNVIRKDTLDLPFAKKFVGTNFSPVVVTISIIGKENQVLIPSKPLVICRADNSGGYDGLTTFTKNTKLLFKIMKDWGFGKTALQDSYAFNLNGVVLYVIQNFPITIKGVKNLIFYSYNYKLLYTKVLPLLIKTVAKKGLKFSH